MDATRKIRLLLVDDHQVVRLGLRSLLARVTDFEVVGEASNVATALQQAAACAPDLVLMDVRLPDGTGFDACRQIRALLPQTRILFLTSFADQQTVAHSIEAGADGYLLKEIDEDALVDSIRKVASGQSILDPAVTRAVMEQLKRPGGAPSGLGVGDLSPQERRVLALVAEGKTNKEIGLDLGLSEKTVKNYLSNLMEKLGMTRRSQAAAYYAQHRPDRAV